MIAKAKANIEAVEKGRFPLATPKHLVWVRSTCIVYKSHHCETTENLRYLRTEYRQR